MTTTNKVVSAQISKQKLRTKLLQVVIVITCLFFSCLTSAQTTGNKKMTPIPRDLEIEVALSALPPHLRDQATVYVLNFDKGFEVARKGTNGFHTFVARTGDDAMRGSWPLKEYRADILYPISFDAEGAKFQMKVFFDIAAMQAKGMPPQELKNLIKERYKTKYYKAPDKPGISYMLSPILNTYTNPDVNDGVHVINFPHMMYYAPNLSNEEVGAAKPKPEELAFLMKTGHWQKSPYPFIISKGPHGYMIQARGDNERAAITKGYESMLAKLAKIRKDWTLPMNASSAMEHHH